MRTLGLLVVAALLRAGERGGRGPDGLLEPAAGRQPARGQGFYAAFKAGFGRSPQPYAIYGYEAMSVVLDAIARAGSRDRAAVVRAFFATRDRDSVLGRYSIDADGDTTLSTYGVVRIRSGRFVSATSTAPPARAGGRRGPTGPSSVGAICQPSPCESRRSSEHHAGSLARPRTTSQP